MPYNHLILVRDSAVQPGQRSRGLWVKNLVRQKAKWWCKIGPVSGLVHSLEDEPRYFLASGRAHACSFGCELGAVHGPVLQGCIAPQGCGGGFAAGVGQQWVLDVVSLEGAQVIHAAAGTWNLGGSLYGGTAWRRGPGFKVLPIGGVRLEGCGGAGGPDRGPGRDEGLDVVLDVGGLSGGGEIHVLGRTGVLGCPGRPRGRDRPRPETLAKFSAALEGSVRGRLDPLRFAAFRDGTRETLIDQAVCGQVLEGVATGLVLLGGSDKTWLHWVRDETQLVTGYRIHGDVRLFGDARGLEAFANHWTTGDKFVLEGRGISKFLHGRVI